MFGLNKYFIKIKSELLQKNQFRYSIILKLLNSKRLLSDHIEVLEIALQDIENDGLEQTNVFTFTYTTFTLAIAAISTHTKSYWKYVIPTITVGYFSFFSWKCFNKLKYKILEKRIDNLICSIERFELCIKRNLIFFNEVNLLKSNLEILHRRYDIEKERERIFINSVKEISTVLFNQLDNFEHLYRLPSKYDHYYEKLDRIIECDYFKKTYKNDLTSKEAKAFYNIFAYIQSQFLMRFGLITAYYSNQKIIIFDLPTIQKHLQVQLEDHSKLFEKLTKTEENSINSLERRNYVIKPTGTNSMTTLKNSSLIFSSKLIVLANECRSLDTEIQTKFFENNDKIPTQEDKILYLDYLTHLGTLENNLKICLDEMQRFIINFNKTMNQIYQIEAKLNHFDVVPCSSEDATDSTVVKIISDKVNAVVPDDDDFFAFDMSREELNNLKGYDFNADVMDEAVKQNNNLIKSYYKPVLKQLREKIAPIKERMDNKEKVVLASKGIHLDEDNDSNKVDVNVTDSDTDEGSCTSSDDNFERRKLKFEKMSKFDENREFLLSKQQSLVMLPKFVSFPIQAAADEDIIE